jgi:hypothetical protein
MVAARSGRHLGLLGADPDLQAEVCVRASDWCEPATLSGVSVETVAQPWIWPLSARPVGSDEAEAAAAAEAAAVGDEQSSVQWADEEWTASHDTVIGQAVFSDGVAFTVARDWSVASPSDDDCQVVDDHPWRRR